MSVPAATEQATAPAPAARWEDFLDILYAPSEVFARRRDSSFGLTLVGLTVLVTLLFFGMQNVLAPVFELEFQRGMAASGGEFTAEQMEQLRAMSGTFGVVGFAVAFPALVLLTALVVWGAGRVAGSTLSFSGAALIATYAEIPAVFGQLTAIAHGLLFDVHTFDSPYDVTVSVGRFLDPASVPPAVLELAGHVEVFALWSMILVATGLRSAGQIPRLPAAAIAFLVWALGAAPTVLGALLQG